MTQVLVLGIPEGKLKTFVHTKTSIRKLSVLVPICDLSTWEARAENSKFEVRLGNSVHLKKTKKSAHESPQQYPSL